MDTNEHASSEVDMYIQETAAARNFFTTFLMCLDINVNENKYHPYYTSYKHNLQGLEFDESDPLRGETPRVFDPICKVPEEYTEESQPYKLEEQWEFLDEITPDEERILVNTWRHIRRDLRTNGHLVFMRFLHDHPHYRLHFNKAIDLDDSEVDDNINPKLSDLGYAVMNLIDRVIANLSKPEICTKILFYEGFKYAKHKLNIKHFLDFQQSMLTEFKSILHDKLTKEKENTWKKFLTIIMGIMEDSSHWNDLGYR